MFLLIPVANILAFKTKSHVRICFTSALIAVLLFPIPVLLVYFG